jgi:hypothetical protein
MGIYFFKMFDNFYGMLDIFSASVVLQYDDPTNHEIYDGFASGFVNYKQTYSRYLHVMTYINLHGNYIHYFKPQGKMSLDR